MKYHTFFVLYLAVFFSCAPQLKKIPEVSPHIGQEKIYSSGTEQISMTLFSVNGHLVFFTKQGQVIRFDPRTRSKTEVVSFGGKISSRIISHDPIVLIQTARPKSFIVFNLKTMRIIRQFQNPQIRRILALDDRLIYHVQKKRVVVYDYIEGKKIASRTVRQDIHHCEITKNTVYIMSTKRLYIYSKSGRQFKDYPLNINASSPFLLAENSIYFGSTNHQLVRFSLSTKKIKWKFKLTQILTEKPVLMGNTIVITPEDHTICTFTPRGTLTWWTHLGDRRITSPVVMKENIALFLTPRSKPRVIFANIKEKVTISAQCNTAMSGNPVTIDEFVYFFSAPPVEKVRRNQPS